MTYMEELFHWLYNLDAIMPQLEVRGSGVMEKYFCQKTRTAPNRELRLSILVTEM